MKIAVLDAGTLGEDLSLSPLSLLGEVTVYASTSPAEMRERIADCDVLVLNKIRCNAETLLGAEKLRLICVAATGYDNIDLEYCKKRGII